MTTHKETKKALDFCEMVIEIGEPDSTVIPVWPIGTEMAITHPLTVGMVKAMAVALNQSPQDDGACLACFGRGREIGERDNCEICKGTGLGGTPALQPETQAEIEHTPGKWYVAKTVKEMQAFYLSRLPYIREAARELGYAIGMHGSTTRDFDLMAMQWRDDPAPLDELANEIMKAACGFTQSKISWTKKPQGRVATTLPICWAEWEGCYSVKSLGCIDLSVLTPTPAPQHETGPEIEGLREALKATSVCDWCVNYQLVEESATRREKHIETLWDAARLYAATWEEISKILASGSDRDAADRAVYIVRQLRIYAESRTAPAADDGEK